VSGEIVRLINDLPAHDRLEHFGLGDLLRRNFQNISIQHDEVGKLADLDRARDLFLMQFIGRVHGDCAQHGLS
jgi:hypothetical protein